MQIHVFLLLAVTGGVRAAIPPGMSTDNYSACMSRCNEHYKDCLFECEAESMAFLTVNMKTICQKVYMNCIHDCDKLLTIH